MDKEPTDQRLHVLLTRSQLKAVDAWRFQNQAQSRGEAVRRLIEMALKAAKARKDAA